MNNEPLTMSMFATKADYDAALAAQTPSPLGWAFQHDETGRMTVCMNDGVNDKETFLSLNPGWSFVMTIQMAVEA